MAAILLLGACASRRGEDEGAADPGLPGTHIDVEGGRIEGALVDDVLSFKGIRYAAPPVGDLRWREPQPVAPWSGVRPAVEYGNDCVQQAIPGDAAASGAALAEDCLYLNVWRPRRIEPDAKLPVLVWIHGGGFLNGGSSAAIFDGSAFARSGLVLVSFNYRLGRLGFFAHPALTAAREGRLGNYGLMDQLAALRWVQRNAAAFGGDPGQVTIAGESAGGISIMWLLTTPEAQGLFHRAVVLSGGGRSFLAGLRTLDEPSGPLPSAEQSGVEFARSKGIDGVGPEALAALRALPADAVNGDLSMLALLTRPATYAGGPIYDGDLVRAEPGTVLRNRAAARVPLVIGTTTADLPVMRPPSPQAPLSFFGADAGQARAAYDPAGSLDVAQLSAIIGADMTMHEPARFVARQMTADGSPAWLYRFGYVAQSQQPGVTGASHASELPFLFRTVDARFGPGATDTDREAARRFHAYVANFARRGDPNGPGLPAWPAYDPSSSDLMQFTLDGNAVVGPDPWAARLDLVERALSQ